MANSNLHKAKKEKNDEFYTQTSDIENELKHYKSHFKDKVVYLNCDDPSGHKTVMKKLLNEKLITQEQYDKGDMNESNFLKYFVSSFKHLGLKKLIATHYNDDPLKPSYALVIDEDLNGDGKIDEEDFKIFKLKQNGDFRSDESIAYLKEADIVVTNPPFSLFREYIAQLIEYDKKFLVVGGLNPIGYKEIFPLIKNKRLWLGTKRLTKFRLPDNSLKAVASIWFTNLDHAKRHEELIGYKTYKGNEVDYPKYDNYDAIEVSKVVDIPIGYTEIIGVPLTFLEKYNPDQFEIVGFRKGDDGKDLRVNNKDKYSRILIKRKIE